MSMIFIVALYVSWCRHLDSLPDVKPLPIILSAMLSVRVPYLILLVSLPSMSGRLVRMCLLVSVSLLSTSQSVRKAVKLWDISGGVSF